MDKKDRLHQKSNNEKSNNEKSNNEKSNNEKSNNEKNIHEEINEIKGQQNTIKDKESRSSKKLINIFSRSQILLFLIPIIVSMIMTFVIVLPNIENENIRNDIESYYNDTGVNMILKGASLEQINNFESSGYVDYAIGVYNLEFINDGVNTNALLVNDFDDVNKTMYSDERIIEEVDNVENPIYIDYKYSLENNLNVGDKHSILLEGKRFEYVVARIYKTDYLINEGAILIEYSGELKSYIDSFRNGVPLRYSWFEVYSSNIEFAFENISNGYLPEELRPTCNEGDDCSSAEEIFENGNYSESIKINRLELERTLQNNEVLYEKNVIFVTFSILGLINLVVLIPIIMHKDDINKELTRFSWQKISVKYIKKPILCILILSIFTTIGVIFLNISNNTIFVSSIQSIASPMLVTIVITILASLVIEKKYIKKS